MVPQNRTKIPMKMAIKVMMKVKMMMTTMMRRKKKMIW